MRLSVVFALFALVAVALAQNEEVVDDFLAGVPRESATLRISSFANEKIEDFACDSVSGGTTGSIIGGCHVLSLEGNAAAGCEPTGAVASGDMFCNNAFSCAAHCVLLLDGTETTSTVTLGLGGVSLPSRGFAFRIFAATDIQTTFTVRVHDTNGAISTAAGNIPAGSSDSGFVQFDFDFVADFSGSANMASVGAIELHVPNKLDTDVVLTDWTILSNEADIFGSVFVDCNCNNAKDAEDVGIGSATVTLTGDASCAVDTRTTTTSTAGDYSFIGLPPCSYTVSVASSIGALCSTSPNPQSVNLGATSVFNVNFGTDVPTSFSVPPSATVFCNEGRSPAQLGEATSSSCGTASTVSFSDSIIDQVCDAEFTIIRTWTDSAGNSGAQTIFVVDTGVAPTFTNANAENLQINVNCNECTDAGTCIVELNASDDCSAVTVSHSDGNLASDCDVTTCAADATFTRTWTAVDDCGNQAANQGQVITEIGCGGAVISCPTIDVTVPTVSGVPTVTFPSVPVTNPPTRNCRFICDDDDSAASALVASVLMIALAFVALF